MLALMMKLRINIRFLIAREVSCCDTYFPESRLAARIELAALLLIDKGFPRFPVLQY